MVHLEGKFPQQYIFSRGNRNVRSYRELVAELPFTLMHPKPEDNDPRPSSRSESGSVQSEQQNGEKSTVDIKSKDVDREKEATVLVDTNLIQLET